MTHKPLTNQEIDSLIGNLVRKRAMRDLEMKKNSTLFGPCGFPENPEGSTIEYGPWLPFDFNYSMNIGDYVCFVGPKLKDIKCFKRTPI